MTALATCLALLLATPAWTPPASYTLRNGKPIDCTALRALPPGEVLMAAGRQAADAQATFAVLEACFAQGPTICDRAWVGQAIFGGVSMAVVDGVAPPIEQRRAWFHAACTRLSAKAQACLLLSNMKIPATGAGAQDLCEPVRATLRKAMGAAQLKATQRAPLSTPAAVPTQAP